MRKIVSIVGEDTPVYAVLNKRAEEYARKTGFSYTWIPSQPYNLDETIRLLSEADAGIVNTEPYGESVFSKIHETCKIIIRFGVGYDNVDIPAASRYGIAAARTTGANYLGVAEMAFALILAARRKLKYFNQAVVREDWGKVIVEETIQSTIGIVGFGAIGRAVAKLFSGWDCKIIAYDPFPDRKKMEEMGVILVSLEELFRSADVISLHIPHSKENHHLIGERLLNTMKSSAVIVNTSRGNIVDEDALAEALRKNRICGAGFDVFGQEPLPVTSPLFGLDNIVLTPHVSSQTVESLWRIYEMAIDIAADFYAGRKSPHILNTIYKPSNGSSVIE
jgi:phosphoglycerate dehydrogenase-like enzyme